MAFVLAARAAPPANDTCGTALVIPRAGPFPYLTAVSDLSHATVGTGDPKPSCQTNVTRSVWYQFTPQQTAYYRLSTCSSAPTATTESDTVLAVFRASSCSGPFTEVACVDDTCDLQAALITQLTVNVHYYVVVWQFKEEATAGAVQLRVDRIIAPTNDLCSSAIALELNVPVAGSTVLAVNNYQLSGAACFTGIGQTPSTATGGDVVYRFDAPTEGRYSFRVFDYEEGDVVLYVAPSCPSGAGPSTVSCLSAANRSGVSTAEEAPCLNMTAGQRVYVFVDQASGVGSAFDLIVTRCQSEMEPNDSLPGVRQTLCEVTGAISDFTDWDVFQLGSLAAGQRIFALVDGEAARTTDFTLRVLRGEDVLEFDDQDNDFIYGNLSPNIAGCPVEEGQISLAVAFDSFMGFEGAEPYHLYAVIQPPLTLATPEAEPNDSLSTANSDLNNYFAGTLAGPLPSPDQDFFTFEATKGDLIFVSLDGDPTRNDTPIDGRLALLNSEGQILVQVDDGNNISNTNRTQFLKEATAPRSPGEGLVWRAATTGTYYARVSIGEEAASRAEGAGDYLLSISHNCVAGSRGIIETPVFHHIDEPNNGIVYVFMSGTPGSTYRLQRSGDMVTWSAAAIATADAEGEIVFGVAQSTASAFYRAVAP